MEKEVRDKDWEIYLEIWNERIHFCEDTAVPLGKEPLTTMFHHILPKSRYPEYRHCKKNIALLHPDVHAIVEAGFESDLMKTRKKWLYELHKAGLLS